uniref:Lysyl-tRNA synthetase n=1 Tax=Solanum tuberosum TaxID=4113 RepID=M1A8L7_SOLTU
MMRNYPQLPHKFMFDKAKIHYLLEIIVHMNLERDSLKRQHQNFTSTVLLKKKAFLKHGVKEALRSCVKALNFCAIVSCGELQDFALNKFKGIEDELVIKLKSALKEVMYEAYSDYESMMNMAEEIVTRCALAVNGKFRIDYQGVEICLERPWRRETMHNLLRRAAKEHDIKQLIFLVFEMVVKPKLLQPTIVLDYSIEMSPLAKPHRRCTS